MYLKTVILLVSFSVIAVNSLYLSNPSDDSSPKERDRDTKYKQWRTASSESNLGRDQRGCVPDELCDNKRNSRQSSEEKPEGLRGQKSRVFYSSSEDDSSQSHEIRQVQKQYHNASPYSRGKHVNLEALEHQNFIMKDLQTK